MSELCSNKSVGMLVWQDDKLLLIERKKKPFGFAPPAGHVEDNDSYEESAKKELEEEVGLLAKDIQLLAEGRKENQCRRLNGAWHYWKIYEVEASGDLKPSEEEAKQAGWFSKDQILLLARKTEDFLDHLILEEEWEKSPGIEPVWYEWLKVLKII